MILSVISSRCEFLSLTLNKEKILRIFERRTFEPKSEEKTISKVK
jgi:hypothetical protein